MALKNGSKLLLRARESMGFTLTELMITSLIGSIAIILAGQSLISHVRMSARSEATMRAQDTWSRIHHLIDQDIEEAQCIDVNTASKTLTLKMTSCDSNSVNVVYSFSGSSLTRNGPIINALDGTLDFSNLATSTVSDMVSDFTPTLNTGGNLSISYSLNILDPSGFTFPNSKTTETHVRSRIID